MQVRAIIFPYTERFATDISRLVSFVKAKKNITRRHGDHRRTKVARSRAATLCLLARAGRCPEISFCRSVYAVRHKLDGPLRRAMTTKGNAGATRELTKTRRL